MALSAPVLSAAIESALLAAPQSGAQSGAALTALCDSIADAVVTHLTSAAVVVVTGTSPSGPVTGTGVIT